MDLPAEVNVMKVTATLKDGVLNVQLPKVTATTPAIAEPHAA
jgi:HSP20 family molecular chaperone IbpA